MNVPQVNNCLCLYKIGFLLSRGLWWKMLRSVGYSRYRLVRYRIQREIGYNAICLYVCVSVENCLEREIAYSADFFQSQVPRTKRYPVYF